MNEPLSPAFQCAIAFAVVLLFAYLHGSIGELSMRRAPSTQYTQKCYLFKSVVVKY